MVFKKRTPDENNIDYYVGCGRYQWIHFVLAIFLNFVNSFNMVVMMVFGKVVPKWTCQDWDQERLTAPNMTDAQFYTCQRLANVSCTNFTMTSDFNSVATEFGLICSDQKLIFQSMSIQMVGVLVASPVFGQLSDWYGRKWILLGTTAAEIVVGVASAWSPNMMVFTAFRFFIGIFAGGSLVVGFTYFVEFLVSKHRYLITTACSWSINYSVFAFIAWATADWRSFTVIGNLTGLPAVLILLFVPESPRWLLQKGKIEKTEKSLLCISKVNRKRSLDPKKLETLLENLEHSREKTATNKQIQYSFWHLFSTKELALHTLVLCFCYFAISTTSYGLVYDTSNLVGNRYLNFFVFAVLRYFISWVTIAADIFIKPCGRKVIFCCCFGVILCCCGSIGVLKLMGLNQSTAVSVLAIMASVTTAPVWASLASSASELFPTPVRNIGNGFNAVFNRIGLVISPQILYVATFWPPASYIVFASLATIAVVLNILFIPETKGKPLPEKMPAKNSKSQKSLLTVKGNRSSTIRSDSFTVYNFNEKENGHDLA